MSGFAWECAGGKLKGPPERLPSPAGGVPKGLGGARR